MIALYQPDLARIELGRKRQDAIWHDSPPDKLPIVLFAPLPERERFPKFGYDEEFRDPEVMLYNGLWSMIGCARSGSDSVPSLRVNFGTALVASVFGLESDIFPDKMPWLKHHLTKEQLASFRLPRDLRESGYLPKVREYYRLFRSRLDGRGWCYVGVGGGGETRAGDTRERPAGGGGREPLGAGGRDPLLRSHGQHL